MQTNQEASLNDQIREFVIAGHGNLQKVKEMLTANPQLLNASYPWSEKDNETAIQAAAQVGSVPVAEFLLARGAPLEICTAAMLGRREEVERLLSQNPTSSQATGAHGIPLLAHSVWSGNLDLVKLVYARGATTGATLALHNAVTTNNREIVRWLLENARADVSSKNYQGKTPLKVAMEHDYEGMIQLLKEHGAKE